jgi:formate dehydrogenase iron-sulfur subunit
MKSAGTPKISRRAFLKTSAGLVALSGLALPGTVHAGEEKQLATLIDLSLCDGCSNREVPACVSACREINKDKIPKVADPIPVPWPRKIIEDWSGRRDVVNRLTPYNLIYVHKAVIDEGGRKKVIYVPRRCMHCFNPACATLCPFTANHKQPNGAVVIDQDLCFGGAKCRTVCPWEIPQRQSGVGIYLHVLPTLMGNGVMYKCDLCNDRLLAGKLPGCVESCPRSAMLIGPKKDIYDLADERAMQMRGHIYGKRENGGTSTLYVSPVSFEHIGKTMERKPGQPDMKTGIEVGKETAITELLGKMVFAAPALGIAAGAFRWLSRRKVPLKWERDNV